MKLMICLRISQKAKTIHREVIGEMDLIGEAFIGRFLKHSEIAVIVILVMLPWKSILSRWATIRLILTVSSASTLLCWSYLASRVLSKKRVWVIKLNFLKSSFSNGRYF